MNLGQITSLTHCVKCGNPIEIYPSQKTVECSVCHTCICLEVESTFKPVDELINRGINKNTIYRNLK